VQTNQDGRGNTSYTNLSPNVGGYDPPILASNFNEGTVALRELATIFYGLTAADDYKGNILVVTGKNDAIVCNSLPAPDCGEGANSVPAQAGAFFPNAADYTVHLADKTGHSAC
jgi:hypothetical protein